MATAFIALGSNIGDRETLLQSALQHLACLPYTQVVRTSRWQETEPAGGPPQGKFLNGVAEIQTGLSPQNLHAHLQRIERALGRPAVRERWGPRPIDLDLLAYDDIVLETPELVIPHPRMQERPFVLQPLSEIAPDWKHPTLGKTAMELLAITREGMARPGTPGGGAGMVPHRAIRSGRARPDDE